MNLAHIIAQLQDAHARLGNHPNVELIVKAYGSFSATEQVDDVSLDFAKQTVYLPVTSNNTNP